MKFVCKIKDENLLNFFEDIKRLALKIDAENFYRSDALSDLKPYKVVQNANGAFILLSKGEGVPKYSNNFMVIADFDFFSTEMAYKEIPKELAEAYVRFMINNLGSEWAESFINKLVKDKVNQLSSLSKMLDSNVNRLNRELDDVFTVGQVELKQILSKFYHYEADRIFINDDIKSQVEEKIRTYVYSFKEEEPAKE